MESKRTAETRPVLGRIFSRLGLGLACLSLTATVWAAEPEKAVAEAAKPTAETATAATEETEVKKPKAPRRPRVDLVMKGDGECTRCHDENDDYPVLSIGQTKHGVGADERTPTCVKCHGTSEKHMRAPKGGGGDRPNTDFPYGKKLAADVKSHNAKCVACHEGDRLNFWAGSPHSTREVACSSCHKLHTKQDKALVRSTVADMCMSCHTDKKAMIRRYSRHPILEGKVVCTDCHNPHGSAGPKLMQKDSVVQTCYTCHMEKRGPFLWNHLPATQDCSICHNPHGSVNPNLLKQRPPFLCQQCHEPTSHRGNLPVLSQPGVPYSPGGALNPFGGLNSSGAGITNTAGPGNKIVVQARACLNCHTNLHGGNNPTDSSVNPNTSRTMRR